MGAYNMNATVFTQQVEAMSDRLTNLYQGINSRPDPRPTGVGSVFVRVFQDSQRTIRSLARNKAQRSPIRSFSPEQMSNKQDTPPTILLVESDDETRSLLRYNLRNRGYRVIVALDEEDAIERTRDGHECPDLILLSQYLLPLDEFINMGRRIRQDAGFPSGTPLVVMADQYGPDMEGKDVRVGDSEYVTYLEDGEQLMNLLYRICPVPRRPNQPA